MLSDTTAPQSAFAPEAPAAEKNKGGRPSRADRLASGDLAGRTAPFNWAIYTVAELIRFRDQIDKHLPPLELKALNLEEQVLLQYHALRELQGTVMEDDEVPVNQRAQVANTVAATLKTLGDQQMALYNSERFKDIETLLVRCLTQLPEEQAAEFIDSYEKILLKNGEQ